MTQSTRTMTQIEAAIDTVNGLIANVDDFLRDLRNEPAKNVWVVGFPQYGLYAHPKGGLGSVLAARLLDMPAAVELAWRTVNGKGEIAQAVDYERAIDMVIGSQEDLHTWLCGQLRDLYAERAEALFDAHLDLEADKAEHDHAFASDPYGMAGERARHP